VALLFLAGCSSGDYTAEPAASAPATTTSVPMAVESTVRGVVSGVFASARVITLAPPVQGVANVALTTDTELVRANGIRIGVNDIVAGATVEATGRPSTPETLVARRVVLL
jgi:hypothetical protein